MLRNHSGSFRSSRLFGNTLMHDADETASRRHYPNLWIVIAAYNEQRRIGAVLDDLLKVVKNIVVVDDGSRDDTAGEVLKRPVWLVRHAVNLGQGGRAANGNRLCLGAAGRIHHYVRRRRSALHRRISPCSSSASPRRAPISPSVRDSWERPRAFPGAANSCCGWPCCSRGSFPEWP